MEQLITLAIQLARPHCCETILLRFIERVKLEAKCEHDVRAMFQELRKPRKDAKARPIKVITSHDD